MRVVLDPGVLVSAALSADGPPALLVGAVREGRLTLVVSDALLAELSGVLQRDTLRRYLTRDQARRFVEGLVALAEHAADPPPSAVRRVRDPDDEYLVALAEAARVDCLVSGDADLLAVEARPAVSPRALLERLAAG